tara:strand:- start:77 stop:679 length:603 start_codon:yes stop_codon:yes gene_type:complete
VHKHLSNTEFLESHYKLILTIQVRRKIYHGIYNNFYKKFLVENIDQQENFKNWTSNLSTWYDQTFYNIQEYYQLYQQDLIENTFTNVIEFDHLLDLDYIEQVFRQYYNRPVTENTKRIVSTYAQLQLQHDLSGNEQSMKDIVSVLPDQVFLDSPWFASYCIFKYETNNHLQENQRQWSIDTITKPIDKKFLLSIADQYQR